MQNTAIQEFYEDGNHETVIKDTLEFSCEKQRGKRCGLSLFSLPQSGKRQGLDAVQCCLIYQNGSATVTDPPQLILVIESNTATQYLLIETLEAKGHVIKCAANGADALTILEGWTPNLILMDVKIPVMDGWTFLEAYRNLPLNDAPVIACATDAIVGNRRLLQGQAPSSIDLNNLALSPLVRAIEAPLRRFEHG